MVKGSNGKLIPKTRKSLKKDTIKECLSKSPLFLENFDCVIIDEAHKLRNVYRKSSRTAADVRDALHGVKKLLLTATPFQNSLMEPVYLHYLYRYVLK